MKKKMHRTASKALTFEALVLSIKEVHANLATQAGRAVNVSTTLRNWLIGCYIAEYELKGADRARYGSQLYLRLAVRLQKGGVSRSEERELRRYRLFYKIYPQIRESLSPELAFRSGRRRIGVKDRIRETTSPESGVPAKELVSRLSFSHIAELINIDDATCRIFYERECLQGNWSVRELRRQVASLYYERTHLSRDRREVKRLAGLTAEKNGTGINIRDPYVFEFLGLKPREVMGESHLEDRLLDRLQDFLLELGHGFCFETRQKRILIGDTYGFIDLVFYHRILKCHVLVDLKLEEFSHGNIGQLNTYVTWYRKHMMGKGDNPPVGLLLCTKKDHALAEYALAGMDNKIFVSKYQLHLPKAEQLRRRMEKELLKDS